MSIYKGMALAIAAGLVSDMHAVRRTRRSTPYVAPKANDEAHLAAAQAKRDRKAAKLLARELKA